MDFGPLALPNLKTKYILFKLKYKLKTSTVYRNGCAGIITYLAPAIQIKSQSTTARTNVDHKTQCRSARNLTKQCVQPNKVAIATYKVSKYTILYNTYIANSSFSGLIGLFEDLPELTDASPQSDIVCLHLLFFLFLYLQIYCK